MNADGCILAFDLGTSSLKLAVTTARGEIVGSAVERYPLHVLGGGGVEQDPEDCAGWSPAGPFGVRLVTSDAHGGLKGAIAAVLEGASWQRCRAHSRAQSAGDRPAARPADGRQPGAHDLRPGAP